MGTTSDGATTRREFLAAGAAMAVAGSLGALSSPAAAREAAANPILIGLVGCGGRGTGAARQALYADPGVRLVAMGDVFQSQIDGSLAALRGDPKIAERVEAKPDKCFVGLDCYKRVIDAGVDVVLLASPPGFRPREIRAVVEAGKHLFAEKPSGTDAVNVRSVFESAKIAQAKNISFVAGYCWRYEPGRREFYKRIHDGAIGDVKHVYATYLTGPVKPMPPADSRKEGMGDVEWQLRNWYNFVWLSGDGLVEQACHSVDKILWAMKDVPPLKCAATGGRVHPNNQGNIYDHIDVFYEWPNGSRATMAQRQIPCPYNDNSDYILGTKGNGTIKGWDSPVITGDVKWSYNGPKEDMYQVEHNELFAAIRAGKPINNGERMARSTLAGVMGRLAAYTGEEITWDQMLKSQYNIFPNNLEWDMKLPIEPMAIPGVMKLI